MKLPLIILTLMMSVVPTGVEASEPFCDDSELQRSRSMYTIDGDDDGYLTHDEAPVFPNANTESDIRAKHYLRHHRASEQIPIHREDSPADVVDGARALQDGCERRIEASARSTAPSNAPTTTSMKSFPQVNPIQLFDREQYLKEHVQELIDDEKRFGCKATLCRCFNVSWSALGGISTATSMIISAIGATEYMEPRLANLLGVVLGVVSGGCIWASSQSKKAAHQYHEERTKIKQSLGVPQKLLAPEIKIDVTPFKGGNEHSMPVPDIPALAH